MTLVDGVEVPWDVALQQAVDALNPAPPGLQIVSVAVEGSDLVTTLADGSTQEIPGVHLFGDPVEWVDNFDGTGVLYTGPQGYSVQITFGPLAPYFSVSQIFGPGDELFDHFGIIALANWQVSFGQVIRFAGVVFESESAREAFNYGDDLTTWSLGGVPLKDEGWSETTTEVNGEQYPCIQLSAPPADPTIVDLFAPEASHLLEWDNA